MNTNLSRQYLKAMGIDFWRHRDAQDSDVAACRESHSAGTALPQTTSVPGHEAASQPVAAPRLPVAQWSASLLGDTLRDSKVVESNPSSGGKILLALERDLTPQSEDLLAAMLKAIKIDRLSQPAVVLSRSTDGDSFNDVCVRVKPAIVVVMAMVSESNSLTELDAHRQDLQRFSWLDVPVAITLHPQVLLENPDGKRPAWEDLKRVKAFLDG